MKDKVLDNLVYPIALEIILLICSGIVKYLETSSFDILPSFFEVCIIVTLSIFLIVFVHLANTNKWNTFKKILITISYTVIGVCFVFFSVLIFSALTKPLKERVPLIEDGMRAYFIFIFVLIPILYLKLTNISSKSIKPDINYSIMECAYAVTGTCIPFEFEKNDNNKIEKLKVYMIEKKYDNNETDWMFLGGHAFQIDENSNTTEFSPESVAVKKANTEAALNVKLLENVVSTSENIGRQITKFEPQNPPHYTYLFHQNEIIRCYNDRGHLHHYDSVYIGEVTGKSDKDAAYEVAEINLEITEMTKQEVASAINDGIQKTYENRRLECNKSYSIDTYQVYMLYKAHKDYISYKRNKGEL